MNTEHRPEIVLGVGAGIAAYKVCELLRRLTESGHSVTVVPTADALRFVGEPTWAALSGRPVATGVWESVHEVPHVRIGRVADLVFVAPATADLLAKAAHGIADDLLTNTLLTARCPVVFAPAMHTEMWEHPATRANVATLRARGAVVLEPAVGRLTGADTGKGRLPEPADLFAAARRVLARGTLPADLAGRRVLVTAGGTREPLDPVRYLGNRSSGRQGYALAATALARGARVSLIAANVELPDPAGADITRVGTARELREAVLAHRAEADAVVMTAAVADFRPAEVADGKIKKGDGGPPVIDLVENPDILLELSRERPRPGQVVVGFAAETDHVLEHGRAKLERKGCDLLVVNQVGAGRAFGTEDNQAVVLGADGSATDIPHGPKEHLADRVWDLVAARLAPAGPRP
ncbi:bifunctional phosphopantothenoylcysteine decarboxylase/phosphopantothenate--cysteine ligase CoaBC [Streptomonospora sp. S1-112]|uniref:Coenzyme A biosynthesis bifunctional protein CoaBC n=1 Tax=Streptomonospora mangrovi TaxID=2883123 RepID=A0A9X3SHJ5_9ACTN|nr:bifunctional phosphopantothenoylcysteine decarboxylase/phosphopantothenate--cysteine ligase CoaBC [Streptomonospora mangrovi]MDA0565394.1 bifunctional phosphopantothenoylcysteine decarboxylase/phosphopantothenate--cysteine ligase CoaBC [Streptomonospora mangrovi]